MFYKVRLVIVSALLTFFLGCSAMTGLATNAVLGAVTEDKPLVGVDTEIVAGDKEQSAKLGNEAATRLDDVTVKDNASITNTTAARKIDINGDAGTIKLSEGVPFWQAALAVLLVIFVMLFTPQLTLGRKK